MSTEQPSSVDGEIASELQSATLADCPHVDQWLEREKDTPRNSLSTVAVSGDLVHSYGFEVQARLCPWCMGRLAADMTDLGLIVYRRSGAKEGK